MQRSASALNEAGNTIDESIALVTGANTVIQNPEQVGTALKTLALRLRGAKVELEEAGLETDNMAESTSTLQTKLKALTHGRVDIMEDADTFKSTTQILREMADAWEYMTDIERASALELMGGKRQANILSSLISNFDIVEDVIQTSLNSENSAIEENAKYMDSMQGRIDQLNNSMQSMWVNAMDSDFLKFLTSAADSLVQMVDKVGLFNAAMAVFMGKTAFSGTKFGIANLFSSVIEGAAGATKGITLFGKSLAVGSTGFKLFNAAATAGVSILAGVVISGLIKVADELIVTTAEIKEASSQAGEAIKSLSSDFKSTEKFVTTNVDRFAELAQGVDMLDGKNLSLSADDYEEFLNLSNQLAEVFPTLNRNYDENGNAIVQLSGNADTMAASLKNLLDVQRQLTNQKIAENLPDLFAGVKLQSDEYQTQIGAFESNIKNYQTLIDDLENSDITGAINSLFASGKLEYDGSEQSAKTIKNIKNILDSMDIQSWLTPKTDDIGYVTGYELGLFNFDYTQEQIQDVKDNISSGIDAVKAEYNTKIDEWNAEIVKNKNANKANWNSLSQALSAWTVTEPEYKILDDNMQSMVQTVINNLDYTSLKFQKWEDAQKWIRDNIFGLFTNENLKDEAATQLSEMFNLESAFQSGKIDLGGYKDQINEFVDFVKNSGLAEETQNQLLKMFDIDPTKVLGDSPEETFGTTVDTMLNRAKNAVGTSKEAIENELKQLGEGGAVDLLVRPTLSASTLRGHGWDAEDGDIATILTNTFSNEEGTIAMNFTPIMVDENGKYKGMLSPKKLQEYAEGVIAGTRKDDLNLQIGAKYEGQDAIEQAEKDAIAIHEMHDNLFLGNDIPWDKLTYEDLQIISSDQFNVDGSVIATLNQLEQEMQQTKIALTQDFTTDNFKDYAEDVGTISSSISTYQEALEKLESGSFTFTDFMGLISEFPELAEGVDLTSGEFKGLASNLGKAIRNSPDDLVDELKQLKENLEMAGKETGAIDQLIESVQNMPSDAIAGMSAEYVTLAESINAAKRAKNELNTAMSENPNEGYETRGGAIEQMKDLMSKGLVGSESELWNIAEAFFGDNPDALKAIADRNADALYELINARDEWYAKDKEGNYTYEGTENFIEDVKTVVNGNDQIGKSLKELGVTWEYADGVFNFDFNNADINDIVSLLGQTEELAGLTSEEFYDMLMQIGQFFKIDWQDADDLVWYIDQINKGSKSAAETFEASKGAVKSFLEESDVSLDWLDKSIEDVNEDGVIDITMSDDFKALDEDVQKALEKYYEAKKAFEEDPLGVNFQLNKDKEQNLKGGLTDESLASINQLTSTAHDASSGVTWLSLDELSASAEQAGMDVEILMGHLEELKNAGKVIDLQTTKDDPLGLAQMQHDAEATITYLEALGLAGANLDGAFTIDVPSFVGMMVAAGWNTADIQSYISTLNGQGYTFTYTTEENKVETLNVNTEDGKSKVDELVATSNELTDTEVLTVNLSGTAQGALESMKNALSSMTSKTHNVTVNVSTTGSLPDLDGDGIAGANGTAHVHGTAYKSGSWGAASTETALVGELGPELLVRGNRWTTIGQNGAEFRQIKKGDIIFNHKQTEDLLSKGYVTGRGRAYASGTAYASGGGTHTTYKFDDTSGFQAAGSLTKAAKDISDASDKFKEVFDWIEVRIEEITEVLDLKGAKLENAVGSSNQNEIIDEMIKTNKDLYKNLTAGAKKYNAFSEKLLAEIPKKYREAAQDGSIAIETFKGEADEETLEAIERYREWVQKAADATQQAEEVLTEISSLAKQAFDNIEASYNNKTSLRDSKIDQLEAYNSLSETTFGSESEEIYKAIIKENNKNISTLEKQRDAMQTELDKQVKAGNIKKYSQDWYDAVNAISEVDTQIIELTTDTKNYQDTINEMHWDSFDNLMSRYEAISDEAENLIDILGTKDLVDESGNWTDEGITSLGLYAQQMENAEMQAKKYKDEINYLNKNWKKLGYTEQEYIEKLEELKSGQYDAIKAYNDTKDAIVDLTSARVEAIKEGIQEEIDAYEELINKKIEELDAEKDLYDFQKGVADQQKEIADIERKIAALSADNSASARAKRAQLEAELLKAQAELEETYYDRSVNDQKDALNKELENFQEEKEKEIESWDEYLENAEQVVADSLGVIQENTDIVYQTLKDMGKEYGLSITESLTSPWKDGEDAIQSYSEKFGLSMSSTVDELKNVAEEYKKVMDEIKEYENKVVEQANTNAQTYQGAEKQETPKQEEPKKEESAKKTIKVGSNVQADNKAKIYPSPNGKNGEKQYYKDGKYKVLAFSDNGNWVKVRHKSLSKGTTGWFKKRDVKAYAKGTTGALKDQLALIDELGEELVIRPQNGRMTFMTKGTGVVPADLTANLMEWGSIDPSTMLERSKPQIGVSPSIINNNSEIHIDASVGELIHVEHLDGNNPAEITKIVDKAWDRRMKELNGFVRKYSR